MKLDIKLTSATGGDSVKRIINKYRAYDFEEDLSLFTLTIYKELCDIVSHNSLLSSGEIMPRNISRKIYLLNNGVRHDFISYYMEDSDGSFYITLQRDGENNESFIFDSVDNSPEKQEFKKPRPKKKKISYHSSGCVRYHNIDIASKYFEPISHITQINSFCSFSIPNIEGLDKASETETDDDLVVDCTEIEGRVSFTFCMAPWNQSIEIPHIAVRYNKKFSLIILIHDIGIELPNNVRDHFISMAPNNGLFERQAISNDQALISYHQMMQGGSDIIYSPNGEGVYKVICSVPMRVPPRLGITFEDDTLQVETIKSTSAYVRFKVRDKHGNTIKKEVSILSLFLDAEIY